MLMIKTDKYTFSTKEMDGYAFINYMQDKYEWGGAQVNVYTDEGLTHVYIEHFIETDEIEDFQKYLLTKEEPSDIIK